MISISGSLSNAATAESRNPIMQVTLENYGIDEPTILIQDGSLPYKLRRFQQSGSFYVITGYSSTTIYYKRLTTVENVADWNAGWAALSVVTAEGAMYHDMYITGNRVIVVYEKSAGVVYARESTDGAASWGAEYQVMDIATAYGEERAYFVMIADELNMFVAATSDEIYPDSAIDVHRFMIYGIQRASVSDPWLIRSKPTWDLGGYFIDAGRLLTEEVRSIYARTMATEKFRIAGPMMKGHRELCNDPFQWSFNVDCEYDNWGMMDTSFGGYSLDSDKYFFAGLGLSRWFNGYCFTFAYESYPWGVDADGYEADDIVERYHIARTEDLKSYNMIPWPDPTAAGYGDFSLFMCGVGVSESGDYICIPTSYIGSNGIVYLLPKSSWFGESISETDLTQYVVESVSINKQISKAATAAMQVSCRTSTFESHDLTEPNALIRVDAGYRTGAGNELVERFSGYVTSYSRTVGPDKVLSLNMMDRLAHGTMRKERLPHILKGTDRFYTGFTDPLDIDMFVTQVGQFEVLGGRLRNSSGHELSVTYAGFDPTDAAIMEAKVRYDVSNASTQFGLVFHGSRWTEPDGEEMDYYKTFMWSAADQKFKYGEIITSGDYIARAEHESSAGSYGLSILTDYWFRVRIKHGEMTGWYSTDGISWTEVMSGVDVGYSQTHSTYLNVNSSGYLGLYAFAPEGSGQVIRFDNIYIVSIYPPLTGSAVMTYLAGVIGVGCDEEKDIEDGFAGVSFSSRWDTPGVDGTWSVSGGFAEGYRTGAPPALLACDVEATDVVVESVVKVASDACGIFARGEYSGADIVGCYALLISSTSVQLRVKLSDVWYTVQSVPHTYGFTYARLTLSVVGNYIFGCVNGELMVIGGNTNIDEGYCGLVSDTTISTPSQFDSFTIDAFHIPLDVVTVRPGDKIASVMDQIANMYDDGYYFVSQGGNLVWGVLDTSTADIDARSRMGTMNVSRDFGEVLTTVRVIGVNAYNEYSDVDWGRVLSGHRYEAREDKFISTKEACAAAAELAVNESQKIARNSITIPGHPALELGDVLTIAESPGDAGTEHVVLSFSETIGDVYEISIGDLRSMTPETP